MSQALGARENPFKTPVPETLIYYESQLGSWLVAICERSENRGSGAGSCQTGQKRENWW